MKAIKFVQTWNPVAGRKQEYAAFIKNELYPLMKALGIGVASGWYTLVGGGPPVQLESLAESMDQLENALDDKRFHEMLGRFMSLITHYGSSVFSQTRWMTMYHWRVPWMQEASYAKFWDFLPGQHDAKYVQAWDVLPGQEDEYQRFLQEAHLPQMEAIGLEVSAGWHLMVGSGRQVVLEAIAPDLASIARALHDERYLRLTVRMEELVNHYESRVMIRHRSFLDMLHHIHGRAIRAVTPDAMHSMVGPLDE